MFKRQKQPETPKKPKRKLTSAEKREIRRIMEQARGDCKPHSAQDTLPFRQMYPDGLCKLDDTTWSRCIEFADVNYQLEKTGIIACTVGNMIDKNCLRNQTVHADVLSGNHIPIAAAAQFLIFRYMPGQGKLLQAGQGIQNFVRNLPSGFRSYKIQMNLRDFFKFPLSGF